MSCRWELRTQGGGGGIKTFLGLPSKSSADSFGQLQLLIESTPSKDIRQVSVPALLILIGILARILILSYLLHKLRKKKQGMGDDTNTRQHRQHKFDSINLSLPIHCPSPFGCRKWGVTGAGSGF